MEAEADLLGPQPRATSRIAAGFSRPEADLKVRSHIGVTRFGCKNPRRTR